MLTRRQLFTASAATLSTSTVLGLGRQSRSSLITPAEAQESETIPIVRRFVRVGNRRHVHYRRAGSGPPIVLIHGTPGDSSSWNSQLQMMGRYFTCFAFDTPGFGRSDPLPESLMNVTDIGDSVAETMRALNLPKCPVLGSHTGAAVSVELASRNPNVVTGVVLDGLGLFNEKELKEWFDGYIVSVVPDKEGGHLTSMWTRFRDQSIWFPWQTKLPQHLMNRSPSPAERIHERLLIFYLCAKHYEPAYRSAVFYRNRGIKSVERLEVPAVIMSSPGDVLFSHLDRLPPLRANQTIHRLGTDRAEKSALELTSLQRFNSGSPAPKDELNLAGSDGVGKQFVDLPSGHVLVRYSGRASQPTVVLLHDAPGSALALEPLIESLGRHARVIAIDLPGCGESNPLSDQLPSIADYADAVESVCRQLGIKEAGFYGTGVGASVAIETKVRHPGLVRRFALNGVLLPEPEERAAMKLNATPSIDIKDNGSHWYDTWMMLRDSLIWHPWYSRNQENLRRIRQDFSANRLHDWMMEVMKQRTSYHHVIQAALSQHADRLLANADRSILICDDPRQAWSAAYNGKLKALLPDAPTIDTAADVGAYADQLALFLTV